MIARVQVILPVNSLISYWKLVAYALLFYQGVERNSIPLPFYFRAYSYYIEVSMNAEEWIRVIDYSQMHCRSWQNLYFGRRVVRYVTAALIKSALRGFANRAEDCVRLSGPVI